MEQNSTLLLRNEQERVAAGYFNFHCVIFIISTLKFQFQGVCYSSNLQNIHNWYLMQESSEGSSCHDFIEIQ